MVGGGGVYFKLECVRERGAQERFEPVGELLGGLRGLESIMLFFGNCPPPCLIQIP